MEFDAVLIPPRRAAMVEQGLWHDRTINDDLDACVETVPDKIALTAVQVESGTTTRFTYRELATMADRIAVGSRAWVWAAMTWCLSSCPTGGSSRSRISPARASAPW